MACIGFIDIFAGAGGLGFGFKLAGFKPLAFIELHTWAYVTYKYNINPEYGFLQDARKVDTKDILDAVGRPDIVIGGPPCRPFSSANLKRNGEEHPEYNLPIVFVELATNLRPEAIVMEEVPRFTKYLKTTVVKHLNKAGYTVYELFLNAADYGVPQVRKRYMIIATANGKEAITEIIERIESQSSKKHITVSEAIGDLPIEALYTDGVVEYAKKPETDYQRWARECYRKTTVVHNHITSQAKRMKEKMKFIRPGENLIKAFSRLPPELKAEFKNPKAVHSNIYRRLDPKSPSITITHPRKTVIIHPQADRIITVREAARLQGFPDCFIFKGTLDAMQQMVADAVPPLLAKAIAEAVMEVLR